MMSHRDHYMDHDRRGRPPPHRGAFRGRGHPRGRGGPGAFPHRGGMRRGPSPHEPYYEQSDYDRDRESHYEQQQNFPPRGRGHGWARGRGHGFRGSGFRGRGRPHDRDFDHRGPPREFGHREFDDQYEHGHADFDRRGHPQPSEFDRRGGRPGGYDRREMQHSGGRMHDDHRWGHENALDGQHYHNGGHTEESEGHSAIAPDVDDDSEVLRGSAHRAPSIPSTAHARVHEVSPTSADGMRMAPQKQEQATAGDAAHTGTGEPYEPPQPQDIPVPTRDVFVRRPTLIPANFLLDARDIRASDDHPRLVPKYSDSQVVLPKGQLQKMTWIPTGAISYITGDNGSTLAELRARCEVVEVTDDARQDQTKVLLQGSLSNVALVEGEIQLRVMDYLFDLPHEAREAQLVLPPGQLTRRADNNIVFQHASEFDKSPVDDDASPEANSKAHLQPTVTDHTLGRSPPLAPQGQRSPHTYSSSSIPAATSSGSGSAPGGGGAVAIAPHGHQGASGGPSNYAYNAQARRTGRRPSTTASASRSRTRSRSPVRPGGGLGADDQQPPDAKRARLNDGGAPTIPIASSYPQVPRTNGGGLPQQPQPPFAIAAVAPGGGRGMFPTMSLPGQPGLPPLPPGFPRLPGFPPLVPKPKPQVVNMSHVPETKTEPAAGAESGGSKTPSSLVGAFLKSKMDERAEAAAAEAGSGRGENGTSEASTSSEGKKKVPLIVPTSQLFKSAFSDSSSSGGIPGFGGGSGGGDSLIPGLSRISKGGANSASSTPSISSSLFGLGGGGGGGLSSSAPSSSSATANGLFAGSSGGGQQSNGVNASHTSGAAEGQPQYIMPKPKPVEGFSQEALERARKKSPKDQMLVAIPWLSVAHTFTSAVQRQIAELLFLIVTELNERSKKQFRKTHPKSPAFVKVEKEFFQELIRVLEVFPHGNRIQLRKLIDAYPSRYYSYGPSSKDAAAARAAKAMVKHMPAPSTSKPAPEFKPRNGGECRTCGAADNLVECNWCKHTYCRSCLEDTKPPCLKCQRQMSDFDYVMLNQSISFEEGLQLMRESFKGRDTDIEETSFVLQLYDSYSQLRIQVPAKGKNCEHRAVFDLQLFLHRKTPRNDSLCPICNAVIPISNLRVDQYIMRILATEHQDVREVTIKTDGSWTAYDPNAMQDEEPFNVSSHSTRRRNKSSSLVGSPMSPMEPSIVLD